MADTGYPCDGCGEDGATETLYLRAPLGATTVYVHRDRDCANAARDHRGGGTFYERGPSSLDLAREARYSAEASPEPTGRGDA